GWLLVAGHLQHSLHRVGRRAAQHLSGPDSSRASRVATVRRKTGDQTDQESRSARRHAAPSVTVMDITIHSSFLPHDDPEASLAFYRDILGFEVRLDVGQNKMRWITVGPPGQPGTSILLAPPATDPGITDDERRTIAEMMAKGTYGWILLAAKDLDGIFEQVQASDAAEVVQEPVEQPYGVRDCAFRDPAAGRFVLRRRLRRRGPAHRAGAGRRWAGGHGLAGGRLRRAGHRGETGRGDRRGCHREGVPARRRWRPPGRHVYRPRRQRPRAASGSVRAAAPTRVRIWPGRAKRCRGRPGGRSRLTDGDTMSTATRTDAQSPELHV